MTDNMEKTVSQITKAIMVVEQQVDPLETLTAIAEEASELAQAALKLRRALLMERNDGKVGSFYPTPKPAVECLEDVREEFADLMLCVLTMPAGLISEEQTADIMKAKVVRTVNRLGFSMEMEMEGWE